MAKINAEDFAIGEKVGNSPAKGFTRENRPTEVKQSKSNTEKGVDGFDFDSVDDSEKACWNYVANNYIPNIQDPSKWAKEKAMVTGLDAKGLAKAAKRYQQDFKNSENVFKYPWWSAARDWDPEVIGQLGGKISSGLDSYKFDPDMARQVQNVFR